MKLLHLLSGGLDSATALAMYRGHDNIAVGFDYGQLHVIELDYAEKIAAAESVPFERVHLPVIAKVNDVVFSGRNAVLLSVAASMAAQRGCEAVVIGCNKTDWVRFPDCHIEFIISMGEALDGAYGVGVLAPLLNKTKAEVKALARELGVGETWSCYSPQDGKPCGECLACKVRASA